MNYTYSLLRTIWILLVGNIVFPLAIYSQENKPGMTHIFITYRCKPADRPAMITGMEKEGVKKFEDISEMESSLIIYWYTMLIVMRIHGI
ncbi:MAG: hypothetical protein UZ07_CHB004002133 [Chlorobi bacterium OLB7]|nr:MAG: hypothetical protein UZ07_CHB004002133 [Chlorobi bacterium OLB7]